MEIRPKSGKLRNRNREATLLTKIKERDVPTKQPDLYTHVHIYSHTHSHTLTHTLTQKLTHTHTYTHTHSHRNSHTSICMKRPTFTHDIYLRVIGGEGMRHGDESGGT